jgi:ornithine decarboxylase
MLETGFDCASIAEIKLALDSTTNSNPKRCIYANPQRAMSDLEKAMELGVRTLTFDGLEELHKVRRLYETRCQQWQEQEERDESTRPMLPEMVLRIVVPDGASSVPLGEKFGAPPARVADLTEESLRLGLPVVGVSFHCGSGCHDPDAYGTAIQLAKEAMDIINSVISSHQHDNTNKVDDPWLFRSCTLLDIGGGFPGIDGHGGDIGRFSGAPHKPTDVSQHHAQPQNIEDTTTSSIAAVVTPLVDQLFSVQEEDSNHEPIQIISEPGRYFVEAAFALCSRIYSKRIGERVIIEKSETDNGSSSSIFRRHYYIAQGVQGVFKDVLLCGESFLPIPLHMQEKDDSEKNHQLYPSTIHGPSGEDIDVVCLDCMLPELENGDWLLFDRMGAYTLSIAASSGSLPIRYVFGGGILSNDEHE